MNLIPTGDLVDDDEGLLVPALPGEIVLLGTGLFGVGMVRIYLSPRYNVETNRTRNILAQFIHYPDTFEEIVNVSREIGICIAFTNQVTHDAIMTDGRAKPLSPLFISVEMFSAGMNTTLGNMSVALKTNILAKLEERGINTTWISDSNIMKDIWRYAMRAQILAQVLQGENKTQALEFFHGSLDATVGQFSTAIITEVTDWMVSKGLSVGWIESSTTVREVVHFIEENGSFGIIHLGGEEF